GRSLRRSKSRIDSIARQKRRDCGLCYFGRKAL
ncbi:Adenylate cyclase, partial [uncultured Microcoleus sp.]